MLDMSSITLFNADPDRYVLRIYEERIVAEKKGVWTWIKAHTFWKKEYELSHIVDVINKSAFNQNHKTFFEKLTVKIGKYHEAHPESPILSIKPFSSQQPSPPDELLTLKNLAGTAVVNRFAEVASGIIKKDPVKDPVCWELIPGMGQEARDLSKSGKGPQELAAVVSASSFVPEMMVTHLMGHKVQDVMAAVKWKPGAQISEMEGALHTFVTPIATAHTTQDYKYSGGHTGVALNGARQVIVSHQIQPDFEFDNVMAQIAMADHDEVQGQFWLSRPFVTPGILTQDSGILSKEEKQEDGLRHYYDQTLRKHMIYHLTESHRLPSASSIDAMTQSEAKNMLERMLLSSEDPTTIKESLRDRFVEIQGRKMSLEVMFSVYEHQVRNEFSVLEAACPQGYVYTNDPPSIFAKLLNSDPVLLNRLQALATKQLVGSFHNLKAYAFNDYKDKEMIQIYENIFKNTDVKVMSKKALFPDTTNGIYLPPQGLEQCALVIHNNSDAFGQNIEYEGSGGSLDGAIGSASNAYQAVLATRTWEMVRC